MSLGDKAKDAVQKAAGTAEEAVGTHTDDDELAGQGQKDQAMSEERMATEEHKEQSAHDGSA